MDSKLSINIIKNWERLCFDIVFTDIAALLIQNQIISISEYQDIVAQAESNRVQSLLILLLKKDDRVLLKFIEALKKDYNWLSEMLEKEQMSEFSLDETDASPVIKSNLEIAKDNDRAIGEKTNSFNQHVGYQNMSYVTNMERLNNSVPSKSKDFRRGKIMKAKIKNKLKPKLTESDSYILPASGLNKPELNEEISDEVIKVVRKCHLASKSWTTIAHSLGLTERVNEIRYKVVLHGEDLSMCIVYLIKDWIEMFPKSAKLSKLIEILRSEGFNNVGDKLLEILYRKQVNVSNGV